MSSSTLGAVLHDLSRNAARIGSKISRESSHRYLDQRPAKRAYFEDAFLARYLGYTLVEGGDLAVRDNRVTLKTLGGLLPVEVLYRRVEDHTADPVELATESSGGVSGLLEVIRSGRVAIANSLGSAIVESPLMLAFLPAICRSLLGQELIIPSIATWWCGAEESRRFVISNLDNLLIRPPIALPTNHRSSLRICRS